MVANFPIDPPALLEINRKIATMGGGIIILVKKGPLFVGSLFGVCLFLGVCLSRQNKQNRKKGRARNKKMEGTNGPDPLPLVARTGVCQTPHVPEALVGGGSRGEE